MTPKQPYYAVIFTSTKYPETSGYDAVSKAMAELASQQPGYLGIESARAPDGTGITVSYWQTEADIQNWKQNAEHQAVQTKGKSLWYTSYRVRICKVEREYEK